MSYCVYLPMITRQYLFRFQDLVRPTFPWPGLLCIKIFMTGLSVTYGMQLLSLQGISIMFVFCGYILYRTFWIGTLI